jgi:hypothetical protein
MRRCVLFFVLIVGCSGKSGDTPATVRGRVLFQGAPLAGGTVVFAPHPERGPAAKSALAITDHQGCFRLSIDSSPYIAAGWYRVALADPGTPQTWAIFPAALRRPDKSGLDREVMPGQDNIFEFHIEATR